MDTWPISQDLEAGQLFTAVPTCLRPCGPVLGCAWPHRRHGQAETISYWSSPQEADS